MLSSQGFFDRENGDSEIESKWIKSGTNILKESLWDLTTMVWKIIITTQLICTRSLEDLSTERIFLRFYVNFSKACQCFPLRDSSIARMAIVKMCRFALSFPLADLAASGGKSSQTSFPCLTRLRPIGYTVGNQIRYSFIKFPLRSFSPVSYARPSHEIR